MATESSDDQRVDRRGVPQRWRARESIGQVESPGVTAAELLESQSRRQSGTPESFCGGIGKWNLAGGYQRRAECYGDIDREGIGGGKFVGSLHGFGQQRASCNHPAAGRVIPVADGVVPAGK